MPPKRNCNRATDDAPNKRIRTAGKQRLTAAEKTAINRSLLSACHSGSLKDVDAAISAGANDWNGGLIVACRSNHADIAARMLEKRPSRIEDAMTAACDAGNIHITDLIVQAAFGSLPLNGHLLECACYAGRLSVVRYLIDKVEDFYLPAALAMAGGPGRLDVVEFMLAAGVEMEDYGLRFAAAAEHGIDMHYFRNVKRTAGYNANHPKIVRLLLANGAGDVESDADDALQAAVKHPTPNDEIIAMLLRTAATRIRSAFDIRRDAALILRLLTTTDLPRSVFDFVVGIRLVFDVADRIAADVSAGLDAVGIPAVLRPIVAEYCVNMV